VSFAQTYRRLVLLQDAFELRTDAFDALSAVEQFGSENEALQAKTLAIL
jgi:hypothetical protein